MSVGWQILIIVLGGIAAIVVYCLIVGGETVKGADRLVERMCHERDCECGRRYDQW